LLKQALTGALDGEPGVIIVEGFTGTGKTALLSDFIARAGSARARVLAACGAPTEQGVEFGVVAQLMNGPIAREPAWTPIAELAEGLVGSRLDLTGSGAPHRICNALLRLAASVPLVICVDDVQYADAASVDFLLHLSRRLDLSRVLMVLTESDQPTLPFSPLYRQLSRQPYCRHVLLQPLTSTGVTEVLTKHLGDPAAAERLSAEAERLTGGSPTLVQALAEDAAHLRSGGTAGPAELNPGDAFTRAYPSMLHASGKVTLRLVRTLALLPPDPEPAALARLNDLSPTALDAALRVLSDAGLLAGRSFRHPAAREATLNDLGQAERAALHRETAELLFTAGAPARVVAEHLMLAEPITEPWASEVLADTAEQTALEVSRPESAMRRMLMLDGQDMTERDRARAASAILSVEWRVNPRAAVRRLPELAAAIRGGQLRDHRALDVYRALLWTGQTGEAEAVLTAARSSLDLGNARNRSALAAAREMTSAIFPSLFRRLRKHLPELPSPELDGDTDQLPSAPSAAGDLSRLRRNLRAGAASLNAFAVPLALVFSSEEFDGAELELGPAAAHDAALIRGLVDFLQAEAASRNGQLSVAETHARSALAHLPIEAWGVGVAAPLSTMLTAYTELDKLAEAEVILDARVPPAVFESIFGLRFLLARSRFFLARGNYSTALTGFTNCGQVIADWGLEDNALLAWRLGAAEAWLRLGDDGKARHLLDEELRLRGARPSRTRGSALRLMAAASRPRHREPLLQEAIAVLQEAGDRIDVVRAYNDLSRHHRAFGSRQHSEAAARTANQLLRRWYEVPMWSDTGARPDDPVAASRQVTALTRAERRVGMLAADGMPNLEIAHRLFVTVSTVEQHLTSVYRKLNVKGRAQLRPWFSEEPLNFVAEHDPLAH
ncbi:AAA family ATPase, partial [Micromonospora sp. NPDC048843]|uniref:AAA family ATPase n=1 Tax=Micromonospora sp. NPDC048843 TaxID=3155389 RepID=UPI0033C7F4E4